jgi:23S rRNA U2552 (ribose-2'-O)-methylase RlmE/FtsJ
MRKILKRSYLLVIILLFNIIILTGCENGSTDRKNNDRYISSIEINKDNAKVISITNTEITNISNVDKNENDTMTKIENSSNFYISNIWLGYEELDKNNNMISNSETFLDLTLAPGESSSVVFPHKEYSKSIKVISYGYQAEDKDITVNLKKGDVEIKDNEEQIENSKGYEVLTISEIYKEDDSKDTYKVKVKNLSQSNLGNIALKIGELKDGQYIAVNHLPTYNILKISEEIEIDIVASTKANELIILGYSYDDIKEKANIDIDLKSHRAKINK